MSLIRIVYGRYDRPLWFTSYDDGDFRAHVKIRVVTLRHYYRGKQSRPFLASTPEFDKKKTEMSSKTERLAYPALSLLRSVRTGFKHFMTEFYYSLLPYMYISNTIPCGKFYFAQYLRTRCFYIKILLVRCAHSFDF